MSTRVKGPSRHKPVTSKPKVAVIYARYSPRPNAREESIEVQVQRCRDYASAMGMDVAEVFADRGISGKSTDGREGLAQALEAVAEGSVLLCYSLSRLARNTREAIELAETIAGKGGHLVCLQERFDTTTPIGRMLFTVCAAIGQLEREQTAERTSHGLQHLKAKGCLVGRHPQYGWRMTGKPKPEEGPVPLEMDEDEQKILGAIASRAARGWPYARISSWLNANGTPMRNGKPWTAYHVQRVLERQPKNAQQNVAEDD
jgi:DNA invertase Pin-like site-specific DNA recombinase